MTTTASAGERTTSSRLVPGRPRHGKRRRALRVVGYGIAGAVLAASTVVTLMFRHDMDEARARIAAQPTEIFRSSYGDIEYRVSGTGPTVLVSHGITGGVDQAEALVTKWRNLRPDLYRFIYVSRFGYLGSDLPDGATARTQAAAYRELLDHLGVDRSFVVGNSAGGASAMWFAIDYPHRTNGLILISSAVPGPEPEYIPEPVAKRDFVYWAAVKAAPDKLLGMLLPKSVIAQMSEEQKDFAVRNAFVASMPISDDNAVTGAVPAGSRLVETDTVVHLGMALDLTLLVPLYAAAAWSLWHRAPWGYVLAALALLAGVLHQLSYLVAMPFQVAADVPDAVAYDPGEPVIVALFLTGLVLLTRGARPRREASRP